MPKVFLAYKSVDVDRANVVRAKLEALGVPLFIDQKLISGDNYLTAINAELSSAIAVLVLWTEAAIQMSPVGEPNFVLGEAQRGYARGILVAATFEKMALNHLPVPFNLFQAPDLSNWIQSGAPATHTEWQKVLEALGRKLNRPGLASLAVAMESEGDEAKRQYLKQYPDDPSSKQIAVYLESQERKAFEARMLTAQRRIQQRSREAEKKLKTCREVFEAQIIDLRAGRSFMPPDPVTAIDDNVAKLSNQIEIYEGTIDEQRIRGDRAEALAAKTTAELVALKDEFIKVTPSQVPESVTWLKLRLRSEPQRIAVLSGAAALLAACVFGLAGRWTAPTTVNPPGANVQALDAQLVTLTTQVQAWQARAGDLQHRETDVAAQNQKLANLQTDLNNQTAVLKTQQAALATQSQKLVDQQAELNNQTAALKTQQGAVATQSQKLADQQAELNKQTAALKAQQSALATQNAATAGMAAPTPAALVSQCDALAAFQYDPDRPPNSGWTDSNKDIPDTAQVICENALKTTLNDPRAQRRTILQIGRIHRDKEPEKALQYWKQAADLGSSHAFYLLAHYYAERDNPNLNLKTAWDKLKKSADMDPPDPQALYYVAYTLLFPNDHDNKFTSAQADPGAGEQYLRRALNADYGPAYYIAGVYYLRKSKTERNKVEQNKEIEIATRYLITSWCVKHYTDQDGYDARKYLNATDLSCQ